MVMYFHQVKSMMALSATYDYGQYGSELKNNIKEYWWKAMTRLHENIVGIDAAIFMHPDHLESEWTRRRVQ
jgi:glycyl-tRNA synthetase (class II)